jgi:hypothetical protein
VNLVPSKMGSGSDRQLLVVGGKVNKRRLSH